MGYRVDYQPMKKLRRLEKRYSRGAALTGLCFLLFIMSVCCIWPQGKAILQGILFQGDIAITAGALEHMTAELHSGVPLVHAFEEFCRIIIEDSGSVGH